MPPLSLTNENNNKSFLSDPVLIKVDSFLKQLINYPNHTRQECSQAIIIYLAFNLARGHLKNILYSLNWILGNYRKKKLIIRAIYFKFIYYFA